MTASPVAVFEHRSRPRMRFTGEVSPPAPLCDAIARVANEQFRRWRPGGGPPLVENSPAAVPILREYYRIGVGQETTAAQLGSKTFQAGHPWSAVFVSYVMRQAGAGPSFTYSAAHQNYIRAARANRLSGDESKIFWAFRATEVAPRPGDLVCAARNNSGATYDNIGQARYLATHCDVVTDVQPGRIRVIGGNVGGKAGQTVGAKWVCTLPNGRLDLTGGQSRYFAVIRCRTPRGAAATGVQNRAKRVMELLVGQYGYPVSGAAGLVGNLIAESSVLPNRIEGSTEDRPMRASGFSGRRRDFTPDEVRDRDFRRRTGPRLPGVGIAQWTSPHRRAGLFRHSFRGKRLGSAILTNLEAQVDYLVTELRKDYRKVNATLTSPGVGVEQASDVVLLRFEVPGSVVGRPVTDPAVRKVLEKRRALAHRALQAYRATNR